jgi:hypothetical protein
MSKDGNIDFGYWFDKTNEEKLAAAIRRCRCFHRQLFAL